MAVLPKKVLERLHAAIGHKATLEAPAKLNLRLKFCGRDERGFHILNMVNTTVSLCDQICVQLRENGESELKVDGADLGDQSDNLIIKAFSAYMEYLSLGSQLSLKAELIKRTPIGAGLGGGSSDAAAILRWVAGIIGQDLADIVPLAISIGSDVPFALNGGLAIVQGIGEIVRPFHDQAWEGRKLLIISPPCAVSTPYAYSLVRDRYPQLARHVDIVPERITPEIVENDFEPVIVGAFPIIGEVLSLLREDSKLVASISGSGSSVFAFFRDSSSDAGLEDLVAVKQLKAIGCKVLPVIAR